MKLKVDLTSSDPEKATGGNFEVPKPGVYTMIIDDVDVTQSKNGNQMLKLTLKVVSPAPKGAIVFDYVLVDNEKAMWKLDQFLQSLGVASNKRRKFSLDTDELIGERIKVRIKNETYEGNPSAKVGGYLVNTDDDDIDDVDEDEDEDELDEEEFDEDDSDDEDESDEEDEDSDDDEDDEDEDDEIDDEYESMSVTDLRKELSERGLKTQGAKPALIARLRKDDDQEEPF